MKAKGLLLFFFCLYIFRISAVYANWTQVEIPALRALFINQGDSITVSRLGLNPVEGSLVMLVFFKESDEAIQYQSKLSTEISRIAESKNHVLKITIPSGEVGLFEKALESIHELDGITPVSIFEQIRETGRTLLRRGLLERDEKASLIPFHFEPKRVEISEEANTLLYPKYIRAIPSKYLPSRNRIEPVVILPYHRGWLGEWGTLKGG